MEENKQNIVELSIVMPCLNESDTVGICVDKARRFIESNKINGEIIVADNGSTDGSQEIALNAGAKLVQVKTKGYGSALIGGVSKAKGKYIILGDSDDSYDFLNLMPFLRKLRQGADLVIGNRFSEKLQPGAMPFLHKYIGNPLLSGIGRLFFKSRIQDFHCGLRGIRKESYEKLNLVAGGMEFASEMIVKATLYDMRIEEVPTTLYPDGRSGKPHLKSFRDGWRHLRFLLIYSPRWLFLYPGLALMIFGMLMSIGILFFEEKSPDIHTMLFSVAAIMIGFQAAVFAVFSKTFAVHENLIPVNSFIERFLQKSTLEISLIIGGSMAFAGFCLGLYLVVIWFNKTFWEMGITLTMRIAITSFTLIVLGFQLMFSAFFYSILKLEVKNEKEV